MRWARCPSCGAALAEDAAACTACGADVSGELLLLENRPAAAPRRAAPVPWSGVAVAVVAAFLLAGALAGSSGRSQEPETALPRLAPTGPPELIPAGWQWKPTGPLPGRHGHVAVWTGTEIVFWGGERPGRSPEGAAYDPRTDRWRHMARSPLENRTGAAAAWTGQEVLVWGGLNGGGYLADGAAYDPQADRWRLLAPSPLWGRMPLAAAWTGKELVVVGFRGYGATAGVTDTAAYDPASDSWRRLPEMPVEVNEGTSVWTGRELIVYGGYLDRSRQPLTPGDEARGAALDPERGEWRPLPVAPISGQALAMAWDGERVVAWDYTLAAAALDPHGGWKDLPRLPLKRRTCLPTGVDAGRVVFAQHCGQAAMLEPGQNRWKPVPTPKGAVEAPIYTGQALVLWLGPWGRPHDGTWLRPLA